MDILREFHGPNAGYVIALYEQYLEDPESVDAATRALFSRHAPSLDGDPSAAIDGTDDTDERFSTDVTDDTDERFSIDGTDGIDGRDSPASIDQIVFIANLAQNVREYGHLGAHLEPLADPRYFPYSVFATAEDAALGDPLTELELQAHGVTEETLRRLPSSLIGGPVGAQSENAFEAFRILKRVYSSTTGYDYMHIEVPGEREWLQEAAETGQFRPEEDVESALAILGRLTEVEVFEQFLHRTFPGKTRFSIEGLDTMILILDGVIAEAADNHTSNILIGMAHRGRLNVLAHILHKPYEHILAEFRDPVQRVNKTGNDTGWTGDVKYHSGAQRMYMDDEGEQVDLQIHLAPNPSHLEAVNPVLEGMARAAGTTVNLPGDVRPLPERNLPILIHGDAAFAGQGVVAETFTLYRVPGFRTGGTIHIITNNQLGYTTPSQQSRSTLYASDIARGFEIPIVHVNADDPLACLEAARIAYAYRVKFRKDFLIDLVGYRRHGHNEGDDPSLTHPSLYRRIKAHPTVRKRWADQLVSTGRIDAGKPDAMVADHMKSMQRMLNDLKPEEVLAQHAYTPQKPDTAKRIRPSVSLRRLKKLNDALWSFPEHFTLHPRLNRVIDRRRRALDDVDARKIDWAHAETLAFASIIEDGVPVRLTGQDVERGTFSQRQQRIARLRDGLDVDAAAAAAPGERLLRDPEHAAYRICRAGIRIRLQHSGAGTFRTLGSPVRRLRGRRPDHHRRIPRFRPRQVGPDLVPDDPAPARFRGTGARSFQRTHGAVPFLRRGFQYSDRELYHGGPVLSPVETPGESPGVRSGSADRHDAQKPVASSRRGILRACAGRREMDADYRRPACGGTS